MRIKLATAYLAAAALLAPIVGFSDDADSDRSHPGTFVKDSVITTKVKTKLAADHPGTLAHIRVDTDAGGVVWLSGNARTQADIDKAVSITKATEGVVSVKNELTIKKDD
jgi:hyperosmotically inducible periplasmic protein